MLCHRERIHNTTREIDAITLRYKNPEFEQQYVNQKDSTFKFYVACAFCIFLFMMAVQIIILPRWRFSVTPLVLVLHHLVDGQGSVLVTKSLKLLLTIV